MTPALFELDTDRVIAALVDVLDRVRALGFYPAHPHTGRRPRGLGGFKSQGVALVIPDPGRFVHDHVMVRRAPDGLMRFDLRCDRVRVRGWLLPQHNQLFMIGAEDASGSAAFGIFNGATSARADVIDGLLLACALDATRTPTACAILFERIGELTGDEAADEARLDQLGAREPLAPLGSISEAVAAHLVRDIGPGALGTGGDWLLRLPLVRSAATGAGIDHGPGEYARAFPTLPRPANETARA